METINARPPETPCCSMPDCCSDKKKCLLCGIVAVVALLFVATLTFFLGKQLGLKQVPLCSPCPACQQAISQPSSFASPSSSTATDPTAGWKTYRNEKYGFEIKYLSGKYSNRIYGDISNSNPRSEEPVDESDSIVYDAEGPGVGLSIKVEKQSLGARIAEIKNALTTSQKKINNIEWTRVTTKKESGQYWPEAEYYLTVHKNLLYVVLKENIGNEIFDQILSTFKFLD